MEQYNKQGPTKILKEKQKIMSVIRLIRFNIQRKVQSQYLKDGTPVDIR